MQSVVCVHGHGAPQHGQGRPAATRTAAEGEPYPAEKARGGEIILNTPLRRWVFIGGLMGAIVLVLFMSLMRLAA